MCDQSQEKVMVPDNIDIVEQSNTNAKTFIGGTLETEDTRMVLGAIDNRLTITGLINKADGFNWVQTAGGWTFPLMNRVRLAGNPDDTDVTWSFDPALSSQVLSGRTGSKITFVFRSTDPDLLLTSVWEAKDNECGPIEHSMTIRNNTGRTITIYHQESLDITLTGENTLQAWYLCKGAPIDGALDNIRKDTLGLDYYKDIYTVPGACIVSYIPWVSLNDPEANRGLYLGWEWPDGRINLSCSGATTVRVKAGLGIPDVYKSDVPILEFKTDLEDQDVFDVPAVFIGTYTGTNTVYSNGDDRDKVQRLVDDGCNKMRKWLFRYIMPELNRRDSSLPEVEYSSNHAIGLIGAPGGPEEQVGWLGNDGRKLEKIVRDLHDQELGFEAICVDNGWVNVMGEYNNDPVYWPALDPNSDLPAMRQYSDMVRKTYGFKRFQLYFALHDGHSTVPGALSSRDSDGQLVHPEWFHRQQEDDPRPIKLPYSGLCADLGNSQCVNTLKKLLRSKLEAYHVNSIKTDYDPIILDSYYQGGLYCKHKYGRVDTGYWSSRGFFEVMDDLVDHIPDFKCQLNNCGGSNRDYASAKYGATIPARDDNGYGMVVEASRLAITQSLYCFPATQVTVPFAGDGAYGGAYRYRSWMMAAPFTMTEAPADMDQAEIDILRNCISSYKQNVRPLVRNGEVYHILPQAREGDWDGIEYYDPATGKGVAMLFKGTDEHGSIANAERNVTLRGLDPAATYMLRFEDGSNPALEGAAFSGKQLMENGLDLRLGDADKIASEWMFFEK